MEIPYKTIRTEKDLKKWCKKQKIPILDNESELSDYVLKSGEDKRLVYKRYVEGNETPYEELMFFKETGMFHQPFICMYQGPDGKKKKPTWDIEKLPGGFTLSPKKIRGRAFPFSFKS